MNIEQSFRLCGIAKSWSDRHVLDKLDVCIKPGRIVALLGLNGAGKSTLFDIIAGLVKPDQGQVIMNGDVITHLPLYERALKNMAYLPQVPCLFEQLTVWQNILVSVKPGMECAQHVRALMERLDLLHLSHTKANRLSGGERKRVTMARLLVIKHAYAFMDEPFAAVDPVSIKRMQQIMLEMKASKVGLLITDHHFDSLMEVSDDILVLNGGEFIFNGRKEDFLREDELVRMYIKER